MTVCLTEVRAAIGSPTPAEIFRALISAIFGGVPSHVSHLDIAGELVADSPASNHLARTRHESGALAGDVMTGQQPDTSLANAHRLV